METPNPEDTISSNPLTMPPVPLPGSPQLSVFGSYPDFLESPSSPIERAFAEFHRTNPQVYDELERLALRLWERRHPPRIGIAMIYETMRYNVALQTEPVDEFKLNNNFRSLYARLLVFQQPQLAGVIELRERREESA